MKKLLSLLLLCLSLFTIGYSQETQKVNFLKNEIKVNALFLVAGALEVTYERILNEETGLGASVFIAITDDFNTKFALTPYYRLYFGKKPAAGFFVEGFGSLNSYDDSIYNWESNNYSSYRDVTRTDFALGFGLGSKWTNKRGFLLEINGGIGRNLFNSSDTDHQIVGRGGITLGYRY
jgi:hypothetical protein